MLGVGLTFAGLTVALGPALAVFGAMSMFRALRATAIAADAARYRRLLASGAGEVLANVLPCVALGVAQLIAWVLVHRANGLGDRRDRAPRRA